MHWFTEPIGACLGHDDLALLVSEEQKSSRDIKAASLQEVPHFSLCSKAPFKDGGPAVIAHPTHLGV